MLCLMLLLIIMPKYARAGSAGYHSSRISTVLRNWNTNVTHDRRLKELPQWQRGEAVFVEVGLFLENIANLRIKEMSLDIDMYLELSWHDERFKHAEFFGGEPLIIVAEEEDIQLLWRPDFYFLNTREVTFHNMIKPNHGFRLYSTGEIQYTVRIVMTVACPMDFHTFPFDKQVCTITMQTYNSFIETVNAAWYTNSPIDRGILALPEMSVENVFARQCDGNYSYSFLNGKLLAAASYPCLAADIHLGRSLGHYLMEMFFPTGLCVVISWLTFWICPTAVPARVSLSFTTLLTLYTSANRVTADLPDVSYPKAVDLWIGVCILFVFGSLLEFAIVNNSMADFAQRFQGTESLINDQLKRAKAVDRTSAFLFPLAFTAFNFGYWTIYLGFQ